MKTLFTIIFLIVIIVLIVFYYIRDNKYKKQMSYSFLIGSGFSVPKGLPTVGKINSKFTSVKPNEIYIGADMKVLFLNGQPDPNGWMKQDQKNFFVEFIADYCQQIGGSQKFQYEEFYDYYFSCYRGEKNTKIESFCDSFRTKYGKQDAFNFDDINLLREFDNVFTQLLSSQLQKQEFYENGIHHMDYHPYDEFRKYLNGISNGDSIVNIHTLNHDLLFEYFCGSTDLNNKFTDGFTDKGSPYFGEIEVNNKIKKVYKVRLKYFSNNYSKAVRLFKLHGSIDVYSFNLGNPNHDKTRIKTDYGVSDFYKEITNPETSEIKYINGYSGNYPDFLSGTTEKLRSYGNEYYDIIFNHYKSNLEEADKLIIIGYGFWDSGINKILLEQFISKGKVPIVIDPYKSSSPFYNAHKFKHIEKSISQITLAEFESL